MPDLRQDFSFQHFRPADDKSATILHEAWSNMAKNALSQMQHKDNMALENKKIENMQEQTRIDGARLQVSKDKYKDEKEEKERDRRQDAIDLELDNELASQLFFYGDELDKNTKNKGLFDVDKDGKLIFTDGSGIVDKIKGINEFNTQGNYKAYVERIKAVDGAIPMTFSEYAGKVVEVSKLAASDNITKLTQEFITELKNSDPKFADMSDADLETELNNMLNSDPAFSNALESYWLGEIGTNLEGWEDENWYMGAYNKALSPQPSTLNTNTKKLQTTVSNAGGGTRNVTQDIKDLQSLFNTKVADQTRSVGTDEADAITVINKNGKLYAKEVDTWGDDEIPIEWHNGQYTLTFRPSKHWSSGGKAPKVYVPINDLTDKHLKEIFEDRAKKVSQRDYIKYRK